MTFEQIIDRFGARRSGKEWIARCPAHEDRTASLGITQGDDGRTLLCCRASCTTENVLAAKGLSYSDLYPDAQPRAEITAEYNYEDEAGELLFQVVRYEPKTFKQRKPDGHGGWEWNLNGVRRVPYRLADFLPEPSVVICEGEKDVDTAWKKFSLVATCNPHGAGKWREEYNTFFENKHVTIIPDSDAPGRKHAEQVAKALHGTAASLAVCNLPEPIKDLSEWPLSRDSLIDLIKKAPPWTPESAEAQLFHTPEECENVPDVVFAILGFLQCDGLTFIGGLSGHAKTWLLLSICKALLTGAKLWGLFTVNMIATKVIYLIPEVGLSSFMSRVRRMGLLPFIKEGRLLVRTLSKGPKPDLDNPRLLNAVKGAHVILDTAARFAEGEENSASDNARGLATDIFGLLTAGALTVLAAHHSPKGFLKENTMSLENLLRGTGDIGAMATTVWGTKQLDEPQNIVYIECVKARDFSHCEPFQLRGRPCIDETADFILHRAPGESGKLSEQPSANPANENKRSEKNYRKDMMRAWMRADCNITNADTVERFKANGIEVDVTTVRKYRAEILKEPLP